MKRFNPFIGKGWIPLTENAEYNRQMKLIEESEFLCEVVEIGIKLLDKDNVDDNYTQLWFKRQTPIESAFNMLQEEKKLFGYKHQIFNEEEMRKIEEPHDINKYMITMVYLGELKQIAVYRNISAEGNPETSEQREILESIKDKYRYIMIDKFKSLMKSEKLTLADILFQTFDYMLNVRSEFDNYLNVNLK